MPTDILPGYKFKRSTGQYHSNATGRFVARETITDLMEAHVDAASTRYTQLTTAFYEGRLTAPIWIEQMRTEQRRLTLQNEALGAGGWDRLGFVQYGRAGRDLRDQYAKIAGTAQDVLDGKITLAQALARANEYAGAAKAHFFQAERETIEASNSGMIVIERRLLGRGSLSCADCINYYNMGWQIIGTLPVPCTACKCGGNCNCRFMRMEVPAVEVGDWIGTFRSKSRKGRKA